MRCPICDNESYANVCENCGYMLENDYMINRFLTKLTQQEIADYELHLSMYKQLYQGYHKDPYENIGTAELVANAYACCNQKEYSKAIEMYKVAIEREENVASYEWLGYLYKEGLGTSIDYDKALNYFEKASSLGSRYAMYQLGKMYEDGLGVSMNINIAINYYEDSASLGDAGAMFNLGFIYDNGKGVMQDYTQAKYWYERAIELNYAGAYNNLGILYEKGLGVTKSLKKAYELYEQAASLGNMYAMFNIGLIYEYGKGKSKSIKKAKEWYQKSADAGHEEAMNKLEELK